MLQGLEGPTRLVEVRQLDWSLLEDGIGLGEMVFRVDWGLP